MQGVGSGRSRRGGAPTDVGYGGVRPQVEQPSVRDVLQNAYQTGFPTGAQGMQAGYYAPPAIDTLPRAMHGAGHMYNDPQAYTTFMQTLPRPSMPVSDDSAVRRRDTSDASRLLRKSHMFLSSKSRRESSDPAYSFTVDLANPLTNVKYLRFVSIAVEYTANTSLDLKNGFLTLKELPMSTKNSTSRNDKYHTWFPVTQSSSNVSVDFVHSFQTPYTVEFNPPTKIPKALTLELQYEDENGQLAYFETLTNVAAEIEFASIDLQPSGTSDFEAPD